MNTLISRLIAATACSVSLTGIASADWTRSYVVDWYEPAHYYGAETGITDPGTDCPAGTNPEIDWEEVLIRSGYTPEEAKWLRHPEHPYRVPNHGQNQMAFRGENRANVYLEPWTTPDPGLTEVSGEISEGFDLDGNPETGFVSPDGVPGIDNEFYRTTGCWKYYRGPERRSYVAESWNDRMLEGGWTVVVVISGEGDDPMNDDNVQVAFYDSADKLVRDGTGAVASNYTFTVAPNEKYEAIFQARSVDGEIVTKAPMDEVWFRDTSYTKDLQLLQAQLKLTMNEDGTLKGLVGGYRPWEPVHNQLVDARGSVIESLTWIELPALWYALKRNADYSPEGADGEKTHISYAMRVSAVPAYVMLEDASDEVQIARSFRNEPTAEPWAPLPKAVSFSTVTVERGIVRENDRYFLAGPDAPIIPPDMTRDELFASKATADGEAGGQ
ncbi:MAG: hypothetical protein CMK06_08295 [Ponticaulis sp.]|nr:hypothetical protein [Ponticaulis sp.]